MSNNLQPGDLCEIKDDISIPLLLRYLVGRTVVLIATADSIWLHRSELYPFWRCSGIPQEIVVSHKLLKKIDPPPEEEFEDYAEEKETCEEA